MFMSDLHRRANSSRPDSQVVRSARSLLNAGIQGVRGNELFVRFISMGVGKNSNQQMKGNVFKCNPIADQSKHFSRRSGYRTNTLSADLYLM